MAVKKILALVFSITLVSSLVYSLGIYAESSNGEIEYGSATTQDTTSNEDTNADGEDTTQAVDNSYSNELQTYSYTDYNQTFLDSMVLLGDSIAYGFAVYDRLPEECVLAQASIGARNINTTEFTFSVGNKSNLNILDAVSIKQPTYTFMSMGMNDINMGSTDDFTNNYTTNINDIFKVCPNTTVIVMGITPITSSSTFATNEKIDTYNEALKQMCNTLKSQGLKVYYIDVSKYLKDESGNLYSDYASGYDGVHLVGTAYDYMFTTMMLSLQMIQ